MTRERCEECGKPLGATRPVCFECGGEDERLPRRERLQAAEAWKMLLGVPYGDVMEAHDYE